MQVEGTSEGEENHQTTIDVSERKGHSPQPLINQMHRHNRVYQLQGSSGMKGTGKSQQSDHIADLVHLDPVITEFFR